MNICLYLSLILICSAWKNRQLTSETFQQMHQCSHFLKVINILNVFAIVEEIYNKNSDNNELQLRFIQVIYDKDLGARATPLNLQYILHHQSQFDNEWRLIYIKQQINNRQGLIIWIPSQIANTIEKFHDEFLKCLIQKVVFDGSTFIKYIMLQNSTQSTKIDVCHDIIIFKASIIQSNRLINVNLEEREITLYLKYKEHKFIIGNDTYEDCQILLDSINYDFLRYLGFQVLNIDLTLINLSQSINCTIGNFALMTRIYISEEIQEFKIPINYIFSKFNVIQIQNTTFENRIILLFSDSIKLQNIIIKDNPEIITMNCHNLEIRNTRMQHVFGMFKITSYQLNIIMDNLSFQEINLYNQKLFELDFESLSIQLNVILIENCKFEFSQFIQFTHNNNLTNIQIQYLTIQHSKIMKHSYLVPFTNLLEINQITIIEVNFKSIYFLFAQFLIIKNISFVDCILETYVVLYRGVDVYISNSIYQNCRFNNYSSIINSFFNDPIRQLQDTQNLIMNNLSLNQIQGNVQGFGLFQGIVKHKLQINNVFASKIFNVSIFDLESNNISLQYMRIKNTDYVIIESPLIQFTARNVQIQDIVFDQITISGLYFMTIKSDVTIISEITFINIIVHNKRTQILYFKCLDLILSNILFTYSQVFFGIDYELKLEIISQLLTLINFRADTHLIEFQILSQQILIDRMDVSVNQDYQLAMLHVECLNLIIQNSRFNGIGHILQLFPNSINTQSSSAEFINNSIYYCYVQDEIQMYVSLLEFNGLTSVRILNNDFQMMNSYYGLVILILHTHQIHILNNIIKKPNQSILIRQLNQSSLTVIYNMTLLAHSYQSADSAIEITDGHVHLEQFYVNISGTLLFKLIGPRRVNLEKIHVKLVQQLIYIYCYNVSIIHFNNISINRVFQNIINQQSSTLISIHGSEFANITIVGLFISRANFKSSIYMFIDIGIQVRFIQLKNIRLINNRASSTFIVIKNKDIFQTKLQIFDMVVNQNDLILIFESDIQIEISDSLINLNKSNSISLSQQVYIQNSEIIHEDDQFPHFLNYKLINSRFTLNHKNTNKQIYVSFDYGLKFALNTMIAKDSYQVVLQDKKQYVYLPTGSYLNNFQVLDITRLAYQQQNLSLLFKSNDPNLQTCELQVFVEQNVYLRIPFNMSHQNLNETILILKPGTIVIFQTICLNDEDNTKIQLQFMGKIMNCQIGEILIGNMCQSCSNLLQQYSIKQNAIKCYTIDKIRMLSVDRGLICLKEGFWRPFISNDQIEPCQQMQSCLGGYAYGNKLCAPGHLGAVCSECDLFNLNDSIRYYKDEWQSCNKCNIGIQNILSQILSFFISGAFICMSVITYRSLIRQGSILRTISKVHVNVIRQQHDIVGLYVSFVLDYIQNLFNVSRHQYPHILMPFHINMDFVTNTSFSLINMIDCSINPFFDPNYWIYTKLLFIFVSYIYIYQSYLLLLSIYLKITKAKIQFILLSVAFFKVYQANILGFFNQLLLLAVPIKYSGLQWIQVYKTLGYNTSVHYYMIKSLVLPILILIVIIIPAVFYIKINQPTKLTASFNYLKYLYKDTSTNQDCVQRFFKFLLISMIYFFQRQQITCLTSLAITLYLQYLYQKAHQPYYLKSLNLQNLQIQLGFNIQLLINAVMGQTQVTLLQYILTAIFYFILTFLIFKCLIKIIRQLMNDYQLPLDKLRQKINKFIKTPLKLEQDRKIKIQRYYNLIRNKMLKPQLLPHSSIEIIQG